MPIIRIVLYAHDVEEVACFYQKHFNFKASREPEDRIIELISSDGGANLMIHQAAKGQRGGQSSVKLVFDVEDVEVVQDKFVRAGLEFGPVHQANGYTFANGKDPCNNSISISSRAFRNSVKFL